MRMKLVDNVFTTLDEDKGHIHRTQNVPAVQQSHSDKNFLSSIPKQASELTLATE